MENTPYSNFSLALHKKNWQSGRSNVCQFELTFKCGLRCDYCYTGCYNSLLYKKKELSTEEVKHIIEKIHRSGIIWLCFTGGDPLTREDFLEIYSFSRKKGFIISIFTNTYSISREIVDYLRRYPPFVIEVTLNSVTKELCEKISGVKGSFERMRMGLNLILKAGLPLKIKTQVIRENFSEIKEIEKFINSLGLKFNPSMLLHPRLNGDSAPCDLRLPSRKFSFLNKNRLRAPSNFKIRPDTKLFRCSAGEGDGFYLDPSGNIFLCNLIRRPSINLLSAELDDALNELRINIKEQVFKSRSKCRECSVRGICFNCPGRAFLEKGNMEASLDWFCKLAHQMSLNEMEYEAKCN